MNGIYTVITLKMAIKFDFGLNMFVSTICAVKFEQGHGIEDVVVKSSVDVVDIFLRFLNQN